MKKFLFPIAAVVLTSCAGSSDEVDGGPCTYIDTTYLVEVAQFEYLEDGRYNLWFKELDKDEAESDIVLSAAELEDQFAHIHDSTWKDLNIVWELSRSEITSGSCDPKTVNDVVQREDLYRIYEEDTTAVEIKDLEDPNNTPFLP